MCNIIIETDAIINLKKYLIENYSGKQVAFVTSNSALKNNKQYLTVLKNLPLELNVYFVDENAKCNKLFFNILNEMVMGTQFVVCFGSGEIVDLVKYVATKLDLKYAIVLDCVLDGNYALNYLRYYNQDELIEKKKSNLPECIYVDIDIISKTPKKYVASTFAYILSLNVNILNMLYQNTNKLDMDLFLDIFKGVNIFTSYNINTKEGKFKLIKLMLELQLKLNELDIDDNLCAVVGLYNKFYNANDELTNGEIGYIFSILILNLYLNVLESNLSYVPLNIDKRVLRLQTLFNSDKYVYDTLNKLSTLNQKLVLEDLAKDKEQFLKYGKIAYNKICNNIFMLKQIYIDKGVLFNSLDIANFYKCLSLAGDIVDDKYISILNQIGVLDNI